MISDELLVIFIFCYRFYLDYTHGKTLDHY